VIARSSISARIRRHLHGNVVGYVALFFALGLGTAYATHPGGANTISSADIINQEVNTPDIAPDGVTTGKIANGHVRKADLEGGAVTSAKILDGTVGLADLAANSVDSSKVANLSIANADLAANSVNTPKVVNDSLFGVDIREDTLNPLDGHDAFTDRCDPTSTTLVGCGAVEFFLGRSMPVLTIFNWAHYSDNDVGDTVAGRCRTRLNGSNTSGDVMVGSYAASAWGYRAAATPVVDVLFLPAGTHKVELVCSQGVRDIVFGDIRIAVVELGMD
jgi:hypothetical protein